MRFTDFLNFLKEYYQLILSGLSIVVAIILLLCKKKPDANLFKTIFVDLLEYVPDAIKIAERTGKTGAEKKAYVMTLLAKFLDVRLTGLSFEEKSDLLAELSDYVENVLSTPQKKGI